MNEKYVIVYYFLSILVSVNSSDVLGCGGFIKSHVQIDFSKIVIKLLTKQGILKDETNSAPTNGYYFIPLYDKGDYILQLEPPPGWSFESTKVPITIDGETDLCSQGADINFIFKGFGITGTVESFGSTSGPANVIVELKSKSEIRTTATHPGGNFFFTPVYPGEYTLSASHPKWKFLKHSISVTVAEGNTDLPPNSLVVQGYDVKGYVRSDGEPISGTTILLYTDEQNAVKAKVDECDKTSLMGIKTDKGYLCHVTSNQQGYFEFPSISTGNYYIVPFYKGQNIHFQPSVIKFAVAHDSLDLPEPLELIGFNVEGRVLSSENGRPLVGATVSLNGKIIGVTKADGIYNLEKIKAGTYTLAVKAEKYLFDQATVKINPKIIQLPDVFPSSYLVCGTVVSESSQIITITRVGSTQHLSVNSEINSGKFCEYLKPGKYHFQVIVSEADKFKGIQFFPVSQTVEVTTSPIFDIVFSQLKATLSGKVYCSRPLDCLSLKVLLRPMIGDVSSDNKDVIVDLNGDSYTISDVRPGSYEISLVPNRLCWKEDKHIITVNSVTLQVPNFVQNGYLITFVSSHDTMVSYKSTTRSHNTLNLQKGRSSHCVSTYGTYHFTLESCHVYESDSIVYNTDQEINEIHISAFKHKNTLSISTPIDFGSIHVTVNIAGDKTLKGPISFSGDKYTLELILSPGETAIIVPKSEILYFNPPILSITGNDDCTDHGVKFEAVKGRVFKGKVIPPLEGVQVTVATDNADTMSLMDETDVEGNYKFPPLDDSKTYKITAAKDSFVFIGPDDDGNFSAQKLAEIVVEVSDQVNNKPLQGALLSLSGGKSYRSNLQTNEEGKIIFHSLRPSDYFLRPMMKEYSFEPASKIIDVKEGVTVNVHLKGRRVAYSAFGQVTSLNGEPEEKIIVVAAGTKNCSQYSEESTSESNGHFRIRGLLPYCSYELQVKGSLNEKEAIERASPSSVEIQSINQDVSNLKLIVFRPLTNVDVMVKIYTANPDHYKQLKLKVSRESPPSGLIHITKVDNSGYKISNDYNAGILVQLPPVPLDNKLYSLQLESGLSQFAKVKPYVEFFHTNSSFKFLTIKLVVKSNVTDQHIKQTSIWTLAVIFCGMIAIYNIEKLVQLLKDNLLKFNIDLLSSLKTKGPEKDFVADTNDIDQIVQSINATKRKVKPKKI